MSYCEQLNVKNQFADFECRLICPGAPADKQTLELDTGHYCDALYLPADRHSLLRFQHGSGMIIQAIYLDNRSEFGIVELSDDAAGTYFILDVNDKSLPAKIPDQL